MLLRHALLLLLLALEPAAAKAQPKCRLRRKNVPPAALAHPTSPASGAPTPSPTGTGSAAATPFKYGSQFVRGVNLGGWFVLEPWITPSIFQNTGNEAIVDEYTFGQLQDTGTALSVLKQHWTTWITEDDFKAIAAAGLNHVRIPLGYWSVPMNTSVAPYVAGAYPYFRTALGWARTHGLNVVLDLHGAPGSQNGYDNSGQRTQNYTWADAGTDNVNATLDIISFLAGDVGDMVAVVELLNEAAAYTSADFAATVRQYWLDGYAAVRDAASSRVQVMIGDAFLGVESWTNFMQPPSYNNVLMDTHEYQIFSIPELQRSMDEHISFACTLAGPLAAYSSDNIWTVLGEWSPAMTDCAQWLNGRGVGARWDGTYYTSTPPLGTCANVTGSASGFSDDYKTFLRQYWEVQVYIGESARGWIMWTWKAENADEWSYEVGLQQGWIPQDPTQRMYPNICG